MYEGTIRKQMYDNGWISKKMFTRLTIPIDLYYLWINNVKINEQDPVYLKTGYLDKVTIESQLDIYVDQLRTLTNCKYHKDTEKKFMVEQIRLLRAIYTIKIEQSN